MLEDRDYMREPDFREPRISVTVALLIVNAVVFIFECIFCGYPPLFSEHNYFALSLYGISHGYIWQLITFQFMHAGILHILFNSWTIFIFGREIERRFGTKILLSIYLLGGLVGGLCEMLGAFIWPGHFGTAVVGASAGGMALIAAFAVCWAEESITMFFYFFPITMRAKYFLIGVGLLSVLCILFPHSPFTVIFGGNVANGAHLGGIVTGAIFTWLIIRRASNTIVAPRRFAPTRVFKKMWKSNASIPPSEDLAPDEFLQTEVDPILDKISAHGIQSLTKQEREILEKARSKMGRR